MDFTVMPAASRRYRQPVAGDLSVACPSVCASHNNVQVFEVFSKHRDLVSLPVLEGGVPIGLVNRNIFLSQMAKPFHRELYGKKSCIAFMDKEPLVVEAETSIERLAFLAVESGEKALADGFLIVRERQFIGLGYGLELMRVVADLQSEKNRQIMQGIDYASVIQRAMLSTSREDMQTHLPDACLVWEPRDRVGGDFYHFAAFHDGWFAAVADCTGHGVPGAFLTLIASSSLGKALERYGPRDPAKLLSAVHLGVKHALGQTEDSAGVSESDDGLDAAFFWFDNAQQTLLLAAAKIPLYVLFPGQDEVTMLEGDRMGLGYIGTPQDARWTNRSLPLAPGTRLLACTDGLVDQIGGPKHIAFGKRRLRDLLLSNRHEPMQVFADRLMAAHAAYQGQHLRRDDLTLLGLSIP